MDSKAKKEFLSLFSQIESRNQDILQRKQKGLEARLILMKKLDALLHSFIRGTDISLSKEDQKVEEIDSFFPTDTTLVLHDKNIKFVISDEKSDDLTLIIDIICGNEVIAHPRIGRLELTLSKAFFYNQQDRSREFDEANFYNYIAAYLLPDKL